MTVDLAERFRHLSSQRILRIRAGLDRLERGPFDETTASDAVREMHNLKGESSLVGSSREITTTAQAAEELLRFAARREYRLAPAEWELLHWAVDALDALLRSPTGRDPAVDVLELTFRAHAVLAGDRLQDGAELSPSSPGDALGRAGLAERLGAGSDLGSADREPVAGLLAEVLPVALARAGYLGKEVEVELGATSVALDGRLADRLREPLHELVVRLVERDLEGPLERRSAGKPAAGRMRLEAAGDAGSVRIGLSTDGRGLERSLLSAPGQRIATLGGRLAVRSEAGRGTALELDLPAAPSFVSLLLVRHRQRLLGLPAGRIEDVMSVPASAVVPAGGRAMIHRHGEMIPVVELERLLGDRGGEGAVLRSGSAAVVVVSAGPGSLLGIALEGLVGDAQVVDGALELVESEDGLVLARGDLGTGEVVEVVDLSRLVDRAAVTAAGVGASDSGPEILVVDDSEITRQVVGDLLRRGGYRVTEAGDGQEAWLSLAASTPDLLLLDLEMPVMDGFELLEALRSATDRSRPPIVVLTSVPGENARERCLSLGAAGFLPKAELREELLLETVSRLVTRAGG